MKHTTLLLLAFACSPLMGQRITYERLPGDCEYDPAITTFSRTEVVGDVVSIYPHPVLVDQTVYCRDEFLYGTVRIVWMITFPGRTIIPEYPIGHVLEPLSCYCNWVDVDLTRPIGNAVFETGWQQIERVARWNLTIPPGLVGQFNIAGFVEPGLFGQCHIDWRPKFTSAYRYTVH